ncbi:Deoxyhypusine hydroxylase [Cocos nucifera]|uniref:Deoxyhypusine hydroxylase n=1 Tax=Cocos nucifera TaxID=13894 RepID=A0A8K0N720_COCNU|nr:Deoxyhypusine hydroxylase [Cocos nucifera]
MVSSLCLSLGQSRLGIFSNLERGCLVSIMEQSLSSSTLHHSLLPLKSQRLGFTMVATNPRWRQVLPTVTVADTCRWDPPLLFFDVPWPRSKPQPLVTTRDSSNLLAHEAAFALGQMQDVEAVPALEAALRDLSLHPIVRHEAAEALGAIGLEGIIPMLEESLATDPAQEVQETCELALRRIREQKNISSGDEASVKFSPFLSVDPAMPASLNSPVDHLREVLLNEEEGMYERYAALFALRNAGEDAAVNAIIASLNARSALLRHEVAYVLGQLQNKAASAALSEILRNVNEHPMVRHEAAEALGSIADSESVALLKEFAMDHEPIVSQSCEVALSMLEYENSGKSFEYLFLQTPQVQ